MNMTEGQIAEMEEVEIDKEDSYFGARHSSYDTSDRRLVFRAGFERGYRAAIQKVVRKGIKSMIPKGDF